MRFIQMWIIPARRGLEPSVEQRSFDEASRRARFLPVVVPAPGYGGPDAPANPDAVTVHQDAAVYATLLDPGESVTHRFRGGFQGYLFVVHGGAHVAGDGEAGDLDEGGAAKVQGDEQLTVRADDAGAEVLLVETRAIADR
jgi:quercetin 2,3-dioxygenase